MDSEGQAKQATRRSNDSQASLRECLACGMTARRVEARFCSACGRSLDENYLPADALRASYNSPQRRSVSRSSGGTRPKPLKNSMSSIIPKLNRNGASTTALAFVTYALVPYLGILFCPGALLMSGIGLYNSYRAPERGGRRASYLCLTFGLLIFCAQLFMWWILYKIPQWGRR
ncbi:MAG: hypothetical protein QOC96_2346 [Acidobacteriota bacterium]|jgi:hypothetical protein|nr:hypothetical protein [Acidobacteriota bacterium]